MQTTEHHDIFISSNDELVRRRADGSYLVSIDSIHMQDALEGGYALALVEFICMNTVYPINEYYNKLYITENGGGVQEITLPKGNYTASQFVGEIQTQLNTVGSNTYNVTYDSITEKITFSCAPDTFAFVSGNNSAYSRMGISVFVPENTSYTTDSPIDLSGTKHIDIVTNLMIKNYTTTSIPITERVPVPEFFNEQITFFPEHLAFRKLNLHHLHYFEIRLYDDNHKPFKLAPNTNLFMKWRYLRSI